MTRAAPAQWCRHLCIPHNQTDGAFRAPIQQIQLKQTLNALHLYLQHTSPSSLSIRRWRFYLSLFTVIHGGKYMRT